MLTRRIFPFAPFALAAAAALSAAAACSSSERPDFDGDDSGIAPGSDASIGPALDSGPGLTGDSGTSGRTGPAEVFVHSNDTLYKLDPNSAALELSKVGKFSGVTGSMVDIALNEDGEMYGTTYDGVYRIDKTTGAATLIRAGATDAREYPDSLSFVPQGTLEADREVLVGYRGSDYIRIDPQSGAIEVVKRNALGRYLVSSGDIVSIREGDFLTYLTVKPNFDEECADDAECRKCQDNDCLFEVNPSTGEKVSNLGSTKRASVFGLAFWAGTVYGINSEGKLFKIATDSPPSVTNVTIPGGLGAIKFFGAGSSTAAPVGPN